MLANTDPCPHGCAHAVMHHDSYDGCGGEQGEDCPCAFGQDDDEAELLEEAEEAWRESTLIRPWRGNTRTHRGRRRDVISPFGGPGGWDEGARVLGMHKRILGLELNRDACATAWAAGHARHLVDVRAQDPADPKFRHVHGLQISPPCPPFSASGKRTGLGEDYQQALDSITCMGEGCGCDYHDLAERVQDTRTALVVEAARWTLHLPNLEWMCAEQVPGVEYLWEDLAAEMLWQGWESVDVIELEALHFGSAARRRRSFLVGRRYSPLHTAATTHPAAATRAARAGAPMFGAPTMAQVLNWEPGHMVRTRGNKDPSTGGNLFSADGPALCLTGSSRSWERDSDRLQLTSAEAGLLQAFRRDYPWQGNLPKPSSRTAQFKRIADVVCPTVAAAVLGYVTGVPWIEPIRDYLTGLYGAERVSVVPAPRDVVTLRRAPGKPVQMALDLSTVGVA